MQLAFNKRTALALLRLERRRAGKSGVSRRAVALPDPDSSPYRSWTGTALRACLSRPGLDVSAGEAVHACVPDQASRLRSKHVKCTVYATGLPERAFWQIPSGVVLSSPELLFVELANELSPAEHLLLGFELTGRYSRDPYRPVDGQALLWVPPVTSVRRIRAFLDSAWHLNGAVRARRTLELLADDAWSPFEAIVATMLALPWEEYGYGLGKCALNLRVETPEHLAGSAQKESRVPDILIGETHVGLNYDGGEHLDLGAIADAGIALGQNLGDGRVAAELDRATERVRCKYVDDGRRDRELSASGYVVYPVFKEDLYQHGGLDRTMMQVFEALKRVEGWDVAERQRLLQLEFARRERQALLASMLPRVEPEPAGDIEEAFIKLPRRKRSS